MTEPERRELSSGAVVTKFRVGVPKPVSVLDGEEEEEKEKNNRDWYNHTPCHKHNCCC